MRTGMMTLAGAVLLLPAGLAEEAKQPGKDTVAREIDLKGFMGARPKENAPKPARIASAEELAKVIADKDWRGRIAKQVDFNKELLLYFAWSGSGGDKLSFKVADGKKEPVVVFSYSRGLTDDVQMHYRLYAVAKNATWRIEEPK